MTKVENEKNFDKNGVYSKRVRAGKRRTYFFDVRTTKGNDYYLTITESKKRFEDDNYDRHKIFIYKEDFVKFVNAMQETVDYIKTELLPDYDFDAHNHDDYEEREYKQDISAAKQESAQEEVKEEKEEEQKTEENPVVSAIKPPHTDEEVDKWD
ncbi:MAG: DUF3276 family protein [Sphingobacteriales bacterium]|nr:DUF3276 family protein [Sphingobacteriales bacterium]